MTTTPEGAGGQPPTVARTPRKKDGPLLALPWEAF